MRAQLRGARKLRNENKPYFVHNLVSELTEIHLGLKNSDFPNALIGSHAGIAEVLLRQILLQNAYKLSPAVMQAIGNNNKLKYPIPKTWVKHISDNGVPSSFFISRIFLLLSSIKKIIYGFANFCILLSQRMNPVNPGCPYVVFLGLRQNNLPSSKHVKSYDIISWYNESIIKKPHIKKIWVQTKVKEDYSVPTDILLSRFIFPRLDNFKRYLQFFCNCISALIVSIFGVLRGKWWYGFLFPEAVNLHYVHALNQKSLAEGYYFSNSNWYYKPLWTYEAEKKGSTVSLYYYSTNMENFLYDEHKKKESHGLKIMTWNHFIVWDQQQENYLKKFCPYAAYIQIGYVDFSGIKFISKSKLKVQRLAVFDITPTRPTYYTMLGFAISPYYSEKLNLTFLHDIIEVFNSDNWEILWKRKRNVDKKFISETFNQKQLNIVRNKINIIDPNIAARSLVESSDAVISIPFTSTAILGKINGIPSVYYDASGKIQQNTSHNISVLKNSYELLKWKLSLNNNKTVNSVV